MDLEGIMLSEISQKEKDKHHMIPLTCSKWRKQTDEPNKTKINFSIIRPISGWLPEGKGKRGC